MTQNKPVSVEAARAILASPDSSATAVFCIVLRLYMDVAGANLLELPPEEQPEPVEIWQDLEETYGVQIPLENENRVNALWLGLTGDGFYEEPEIFRAVCAALYDGDIGDPMDGLGDDLGIEEILWAVYEVSLWRGAVEEFDPRIQAMITQATETDSFEVDEADVIYSLVAGLRDDLASLGMDANDLDEMLGGAEL